MVGADIVSSRSAGSSTFGADDSLNVPASARASRHELPAPSGLVVRHGLRSQSRRVLRLGYVSEGGLEPPPGCPD